jgi:hypothetical protein
MLWYSDKLCSKGINIYIQIISYYEHLCIEREIEDNNTLCQLIQFECTIKLGHKHCTVYRNIL